MVRPYHRPYSPEPTQPSDTEDIISFYSANAGRCLQEAEKRKFKYMGNYTVTPATVTREDIAVQKHLQIWAICPYGGLGPMFRRFLYGEEPKTLINFTANKNKPHAANIYLQSLQAYALHGVLPLANTAWSATRRDNQRFYGHSYTAPTPQVHFLQQLGLACTKAFAAHLHRQSRRQSSSPSQAGPNNAPPGLSSPFSDPRCLESST